MKKVQDGDDSKPEVDERIARLDHVANRLFSFLQRKWGNDYATEYVRFNQSTRGQEGQDDLRSWEAFRKYLNTQGLDPSIQAELDEFERLGLQQHCIAALEPLFQTKAFQNRLGAGPRGRRHSDESEDDNDLDSKIMFDLDTSIPKSSVPEGVLESKEGEEIAQALVDSFGYLGIKLNRKEMLETLKGRQGWYSDEWPWSSTEIGALVQLALIIIILETLFVNVRSTALAATGWHDIRMAYALFALVTLVQVGLVIKERQRACNHNHANNFPVLVSLMAAGVLGLMVAELYDPAFLQSFNPFHLTGGNIIDGQALMFDVLAIASLYCAGMALYHLFTASRSRLNGAHKTEPEVLWKQVRSGIDYLGLFLSFGMMSYGFLTFVLPPHQNEVAGFAVGVSGAVLMFVALIVNRVYPGTLRLLPRHADNFYVLQKQSLEQKEESISLPDSSTENQEQKLGLSFSDQRQPNSTGVGSNICGFYQNSRPSAVGLSSRSLEEQFFDTDRILTNQLKELLGFTNPTQIPMPQLNQAVLQLMKEEDDSSILKQKVVTLIALRDIVRSLQPDSIARAAYPMTEASVKYWNVGKFEVQPPNPLTETFRLKEFFRELKYKPREDGEEKGRPSLCVDSHCVFKSMHHEISGTAQAITAVALYIANAQESNRSKTKDRVPFSIRPSLTPFS